MNFDNIIEKIESLDNSSVEKDKSFFENIVKDDDYHNEYGETIYHYLFKRNIAATLNVCSEKKIKEIISLKTVKGFNPLDYFLINGLNADNIIQPKHIELICSKGIKQDVDYISIIEKLNRANSPIIEKINEIYPDKIILRDTSLLFNSGLNLSTGKRMAISSTLCDILLNKTSLADNELSDIILFLLIPHVYKYKNVEKHVLQISSPELYKYITENNKYVNLKKEQKDSIDNHISMIKLKYEKFLLQEKTVSNNKKYKVNRM